MKMTSKEFRTKLNAVKKQILARIKEVMGEIGTKVCVRMYHEYDITETQYTYFEVDGDGYGRELFIDTVLVDARDGKIGIMLHDSEDCYEPWWDLEDMTVTDANYLLEELEDIADFCKENKTEVLTDYDRDFDWENYLIEIEGK
jgi:hypothetical protein